jgi:uncharacterized membrane protein
MEREQFRGLAEVALRELADEGPRPLYWWLAQVERLIVREQERPQLRVLGPVDEDADDLPELREVGQVVEPASRPKLLDASQYLAELDGVRGEVCGESDEDGRARLRAAKFNVHGERGSVAHASLLEAIGEHGWEAVRELFRWAWREVAAGRRKPVLQACSLSPGAIGALLEAYACAQQEERERQARADRKAAEERPASPPMDFDTLAAASAEATRRLMGGAS